MRAVVVEGPGVPPRATDGVLPEPGPHQVRVRVDATSLNYSDLIRSRGSGPFPFTPGAEVAGVVDAVGPDCDVSVGACVAAILPDRGGCAEYAIAESAHLLPLGSLDAPVAAASLLTFLTAWLAVEGCPVRASDDVLIHAAGGGVGTAAIQLTRRIGARTAALASTERKRALASHLGADITFDSMDSAVGSRLLDWSPLGVDAIIDGVGGDTWQLNRAVLRCGGAVALFGFAGGTRLVLDVPTEVIAAELRLFGFAASSRDLLPSRLSAFGDAVLPLLEAGYVAPVIADLLPFERVGEAYRAMAAREVAGKIVMVP